MKITGQWRDDHLPCFSFEHNGVNFEVNWSHPQIVGKLQLVEAGDITLEQALKVHPDLLAIINNPFDAQDTEYIEVEDERDIGGDLTYHSCCVGAVTINPK